MIPSRIIQVITTGFRAAHQWMFKPENAKQEEYPHNFKKLYSRLEDEMYGIYSGMSNNSYEKIYRQAGAVIAQASMIAEMADNILHGNPDKAAEV